MGLPRILSPAPVDSQAEPAVTTIDGLFRQYAPTVAALGLAMLGKSDEAEDLVQDVFVRAWRGMGQLHNPLAIKSWLMTITVRVAQTRLARRRVARLFLPTTDVNIEEIAAPEATPEERMMLERLFQILDTLPADLRIAWVLRYLHSESVEEVAVVCGWSLSTAKRRIGKAHKRVMQRMQP